MKNLISIDQIKANLPSEHSFLDYFLEYNDTGVNVVIISKFTGLRTVFYYSYIKECLFTLNKIVKVVPKGNPPNVEIITINI